MFAALTLRDFLSFGPGSTTVPLAPLNVLIGPNGAGKSNLVEAFALLRAVPKDLPLPVRQGGGVDEWLWSEGKKRAASASVEVLFAEGLVHDKRQHGGVRYRLEFGSSAGAFEVLDERIENERGAPKPYFYFGYENGHPMINVRGADQPRALKRADIDRSQSILSQRRDPESYPEVTRVGSLLKEIAIYRSWSFGPDSTIRSACRADVESHTLLEDFSNLPARIAVLKRDPAVKRTMIELLRELSPHFSDIEVIPEGGRLQLYVTDRDRNVPAHRLSDGTLRYLALVAILLDPKEGRVVVIEEPELGLHPDVFPTLRDLFSRASERTQLVITTHSTQLVDSFTEQPECVVVCDRTDGPSTVRRLTAENIDRWREFGSLGALWMSGRLGGTRW